MHNRWFKCAAALKFEVDNKITQSAWEPILKQLKHIDIKPNQEYTTGFSPVFGYAAPRMQSHQVQNFLFVSMTVEEKKIQASKLKRLQKIAVDDRAKSQNQKVEELGKDVIDAIKEGVKSDMIRKAEAAESYINIMLDVDNKVLFIDDTSPKKIEHICDWLLRVDPSMTFKPYFDASLEVHLTSWLYNPAMMPSEMTLGEEVTLQSSEKSKAALSGQDLHNEEVKVLLNHDKKVVDLSVIFKERLVVKIKADGLIAKLKPTDMLKGTVEKPEGESSIMESFEADWVVMANEVSNLFKWIEENADVQSSNGQKDSAANVVFIKAVDVEKEAGDALEGMTG
jgi:recombination associated protein RdgC